MLQVLRQQASSWVIKILLGLLVVSFGIWGINDIFLGERDPVVAKVGGVKLTRSQVSDEIRQEMNRLRTLFGGRLDPSEAERMGINDQVLNNMINRTAVAIGARDLGITISDDLVARTIRSDETFFGPGGKFNRAVFANALNQAGMSEGQYVAALRRDLAASYIHRAVGSNVPVPSVMSDPLVRFRSETRTARAITVPLPPEKAVKAPSEQEIKAYYDANSSRFMAPAYRDITFIDLDPAAMGNEIQISDDRLKQAYAERSDEFSVPDRRQLEQIVFQNEAAAKAAAKAIAAGKSFADAAKEADKSVKPVALGWVQKKDLLPELAGPVFALAKGGVSAPIKSGLGWHIVRVVDVQVGRQRSFEEVRDQLRKTLATREAMDAIFAITNKIEDALAGGASLEEAARQNNLKAVRIEAIDSRGRLRSGKAAENLPKSSNFLRVAFETGEGQDSQMTETPSGGFFILHVNKVTKPVVRPLKEVRDQVIRAWTSDQRAKIAEKRAQALLDRIKGGEKPDALAKKEKLKITTTKPFSRLTHDSESGLPAALMEKLFSLTPGEAAMAEGNDAYIIAVLKEIKEPSEKDKTAVSEALRREIRQGVSGDLYQQFVAALRGRVSITTNPGLLRDTN